MKKGTTMGSGHEAMNRSKAGVKHGPNRKHVVQGGRAAGRPSGPTTPIKGMNRGGV